MSAKGTIRIERDDELVERPWQDSDELIDWSGFPQGYSLLLNERYQFPVDMAMWRMKLDCTRQLFIDDHVIAHVAGVERETYSAKDHPKNPIFDDKSHGMSWTICPDPENGYRLYYNSKGNLIHVAFSQDGINWQRREIGVWDLSTCKPEQFPGGPNDVVCYGQIHGMFYEPDDPDPSQRWKAILRAGPSTGYVSHPYAEDERLSRASLYGLYVSPDGFRWSKKADTAIPKAQAHFRAPNQLILGGSDVLRVRWDPKLKKYIANTKATMGPDLRFTPVFHAVRVIGQCESDDLIHWSTPRIYAYPDAEDAKAKGMYGIYEADGFPYESMWLNNFSMTIYVPPSEQWMKEKNQPVNRRYIKRNWLRLAASRDGRHWYYFGDRKPFIPLGPEGSWKPHYMRALNLVTTGGPVVLDDELRFYYFCGNIDGPRAYHKYSLGLATLRRDGFASLNADDAEGLVVTRPLVFEGQGNLFVNADVAKDGCLQVSVVTESGEQIEGFRQADCPAIVQDGTKIKVAWKSDKTLAELKDRYVRLAFHLKKAKLYSFWIE